MLLSRFLKERVTLVVALLQVMAMEEHLLQLVPFSILYSVTGSSRVDGLLRPDLSRSKSIVILFVLVLKKCLVLEDFEAAKSSRVAEQLALLRFR